MAAKRSGSPDSYQRKRCSSVSPYLEVDSSFGLKGTMDRVCLLYNDEELSDIVFMVGEEPNVWRIAAHKLILSKGSPVFQAMFQSNLAEREVGAEVHVPDLKPDGFQELIRYLYTGSVRLDSVQETIDIHHAAHKYMVCPLVDLCVEYLTSAVNVTNVLCIYQKVRIYDEEHDNATLVLKCLKLIDENIDYLIGTKAFENLDQNTLKDFVSRGNLNLSSEIVLFMGLVHWAAFECKRLQLPITQENKRMVLGDMLFNVRFSSLTRINILQGPAASGILTEKDKTQILGGNYYSSDLAHREYCQEFILSRFTYPIRYESNKNYEHCLSFTLDRDVILEQVGLTAECKSTSSSIDSIEFYYDNGVHMKLMDDDKVITEVMCGIGERIPTNDVNSFKLGFLKPVFLKSNKQYKIYAWVNSPLKITMSSRGHSTCTWDDGMCAYRLVQWQDCQLPTEGENGTSVERGQYFALHVYV